LAEATDLEPFEWLARLGPKLLDRQPAVRFWRRYYEGNHDLPAGPNQHAAAYRRFQKMARTNLCKLCVESRVHRTNAIGFRDPKWTSTDPDPVWQLWQRARLDARQYGIWRKAYSRSAAYVIVGVDPRKPQTPRVTIEGPETVIVETDPADAGRRLAALRLWHDDIAKRWMATLYLRGASDTAPGRRLHWQSKQQVGKKRAGQRISWKPDAWEERDQEGRTLPGVPVVPFLNGDEGEEPVAAFDAGIDDQNRLNLTLLNRLSSERYAAFRQAILLNYKVDEDPVTGEPIAPWKPGVTQIGTIPPPDEPGDPAVQLIQLQQTDTSQMLRGVDADMRAFAAVTLTPVYYLPGDITNLGADAIGALDAGHNAQVRQNSTLWGEDLEEVLQLMADAAELEAPDGGPRDLSDSEIVWARPENFVPSQIGDYLSKMKDAGIPLPMAVEEVGWSPQRVQALRSEMATQAALAGLAAPIGQQPAATRVPVFQAPGESV
jgi:hypothetical protein